jgi:hypothetical protein
LQGLSFAFRERGQDIIPHREDGGVQPLVEFEPRWREAEQVWVAAPSPGTQQISPRPSKVLHHPLIPGEINTDPLGQSALINLWRIVKRSENRRFHGC